MGACLGKPKTGDSERELGPPGLSLHSVDDHLAGAQKDPQAQLANGHTLNSNDLQANGHARQVEKGKEAVSKTKKPSLKSATNFSKSQKHDQQALRRSAEFWDSRDVGTLPSSELVAHYHKDSELILKSLGRLQQVLNVSPRSSELGVTDSAQLDRASVSLRAGQEPSARDLLRAATFDTQASESLSVCADDGLVPGLPNQSLRVLLSSDPLITGAREDFEDGRMLSARKKLKSWCKRHGLTMKELEAHSNQIGLDIAELDKHCAVIEKAVEIQRNESGYRTARDDGELRVLYKAENKGAHHCVKMEATLPFPLERPLSLAREFDLMKTWNNYISESELLYAPSIWESFVYAGLWMPMPFPNMECLGRGRGYDLSEEHKCLMVACESIEEHELPKGAKPLPKVKKRHHRAEIISGSSIRFEPLPPLPGQLARTKGTIVMIIDAHVPHVPAFIVNWVLGVMAPFAHKQIKKLLANDYDDPQKPFPKRMAENHLLYDKVRKTVKEGLEKHYGQHNAASHIS